MADPVVIVDHDPDWPAQFDFLRARAQEALGHLAQAIEHVGSTSVPGLPAKPIIDLDVVVASPDRVPLAVAALARIGYRHRGDLGVPGREAFEPPPGPIRHHLYLCAVGARELRRHLTFRDHLRAHPDTAAAYAELKRALAVRFRDDREAYTEGKAAFVEEVLARAAQGDPAV